MMQTVLKDFIVRGMLPSHIALILMNVTHQMENILDQNIAIKMQFVQIQLEILLAPVILVMKILHPGQAVLILMNVSKELATATFLLQTAGILLEVLSALANRV